MEGKIITGLARGQRPIVVAAIEIEYNASGGESKEKWPPRGQIIVRNAIYCSPFLWSSSSYHHHLPASLSRLWTQNNGTIVDIQP